MGSFLTAFAAYVTLPLEDPTAVRPSGDTLEIARLARRGVIRLLSMMRSARARRC
jgi:hypothetical protein